MIQMSAAERLRLAKELGLNEQYLYQCFTGRRLIPADRCHSIERASRGAVTVEALRSDIRWLRVPDPQWPHPAGRPCIDVAAPQESTHEA